MLSKVDLVPYYGQLGACLRGGEGGGQQAVQWGREGDLPQVNVISKADLVPHYGQLVRVCGVSAGCARMCQEVGVASVY